MLGFYQRRFVRQNVVARRIGSVFVVTMIFLGMVQPLPVFASQVTADSLVGYWKFDETAFNTCSGGQDSCDSSGDAHHGTESGALTISTDLPSAIGFSNARSVSFDGVDDFISAGDIDLTTSLSVSAWVKMNGLGSVVDIISKFTGSDGSGGFDIFFNNATGTFQFYIEVGTTDYILDSEVIVSNNTWYHVAATYDGETQRIYINGTEANSDASPSGSMSTNNNNLTFGRRSDGIQPFAGKLDDIRLYKRALSAAEITDLAAGRHTAAIWDGSTHVGLEHGTNWNTNVVPDPYTRITVPFTVNKLTLTGAVSAAGLTINTGTLLHLNGTGFTMKDSGSFTNYGTLTLKNTETLTSFTNDTSKGTVMLIGTGSTSGFKTGNAYHHLTLNDGLITYLKFDETSGTRAADSSGYSNSGSLQSGVAPSTTVAPVNFHNPRSVAFDGLNDQVSMQAIPGELLGSGSKMVTLWVYPTRAQNGFFYMGPSGGGNQGESFRIVTTSAGLLQVDISSGVDTSALTVPQNKWSLISVAWNARSSTWTACVNTDCETLTLPQSRLAQGFYLVGYNEAGGHYMQGNIDDVRVYNRVLPPGEIAALVAGNQPSPSRGTIELSANTDINGDLTLNGTTLFSSGKTLTVGGSWINNGSIFHADSWIVRMDGDASTIRIQSAGQPFNDLHLEGDGTYTLSDTLTVNGALNLTDGTLDVDSTGNYPIHVNVLSQTDGVFIPRDGTVTLIQPTDQVLQYTGTLNNLIIEDPTERGLVGYWKFDEGTNTGAILDSSGYGNTGTRRGTGALVWTGSTLPSLSFENPFSMSFRGGSNYVSVSGFADVPGSTLTVCTWLRTTMSGVGHIVSQNRTPANFDHEYIFRMTSGKVNFWDYGTGGQYGFHEDWTNSTAVNDGSWHHACFVKNGVSGAYYLDGVLDGTRTADSDISYGTGAFIIGRDTRDETAQFMGELDDVRIYNRSLSAGEIYNLYSGIYADGDTSTTLVTLDSSGGIDLSTISIISGIFDLTSGTQIVEVSGDWNNYAGSEGLMPGTSSTVTFDGSGTQNIRGSTSFSTLEMTGTSARTVYFGAGTTQWIGTNLVLQGASSNLLTLAPLSPGYTWYLDLGNSATQTIDSVSPSYSDASSGLALLADDGTSVDGGYNVHWSFLVPSSSTGGGEASGGGTRGHGTNASRAIASIQERYRRALVVNDEAERKTVPMPQTQPTEDLPDSIGTYGISTRRNRMVLTTDDVQIVYRDVASDMWYSPYVASVIESNIARGYKDESGKLTGEFGVDKSITYAEILKMTLEAAKKSTIKTAPPRNKSAQGDWSSPYVGIAEELQLSVIGTDVNVHTPITRGEVVQLIMETMGITIGKTPSGFQDVPATHPHSHAIAAAAFFGLIEGDRDANGTLLNTFRPDVQINRAEAAKLIALAKELQKMGAVAPSAFGGMPTDVSSSIASMSSSSSVTSSVVSQQAVRATVIAPQLNVRMDSRVESEHLRTLYYGAIVEILWSQSNGWSRIKDAYGREGFVMTQFLAIQE